MDHVLEQIETALERALSRTEGNETPSRLRAAMRHAVFPGGARIRPALCIAVAHAAGSKIHSGVEDVAAALELLHCASLVHDDLPCFDAASTRRGLPSVHRAFGEELAVLAGDGLIVLAFEVVAQADVDPKMLPDLLSCIAKGVGAHGGLVAGQAWESEEDIRLRQYHRAKTGALFEAATRAGALLAGSKDKAWARFGGRLGESYQVADDLKDTLDDPDDLGKPVGQDSANDRPNAALSLGVGGAMTRLEQLLAAAIHAIPPCPHPEDVVDWVDAFARRLYPRLAPAGIPRLRELRLDEQPHAHASAPPPWRD